MSMYEGFESWYRASDPSVFASLVVAVGDRGIAEDACAEGFARALGSWSRVSGMESPGGWVFRVALNDARRTRRRAAIEQRLLRRSTPTDQEANPSQVDPVLWEAVRNLPYRQRRAIALRYIDDATQSVIADQMGVQPGTAAATLAHARRNLRTELEEFYP